jgi:hypothetical protein
MSRYIKVEDAIETAISGCASWDGGYFPSMDEPIKEEFEAVNDKCIDLVRCMECKWFDGKECCDKNGLFVGFNYETFFCADGERRTK